jgi:hypothetical protein
MGTSSVLPNALHNNAATQAVADGLHSLGGRVLFVSAARPTVGRGSLPNREV